MFSFEILVLVRLIVLIEFGGLVVVINVPGLHVFAVVSIARVHAVVLVLVVGLGLWQWLSWWLPRLNRRLIQTSVALETDANKARPTPPKKIRVLGRFAV